MEKQNGALFCLLSIVLGFVSSGDPERSVLDPYAGFDPGSLPLPDIDDIGYDDEKVYNPILHSSDPMATLKIDILNDRVDHLNGEYTSLEISEFPRIRWQD